MTLETTEGIIDAGICISCSEIYGIVLKHKPAYKWQLDSIEVLVEDRVYLVHRCDPMEVDENPYFNIRIIQDE